MRGVYFGVVSIQTGPGEQANEFFHCVVDSAGEAMEKGLAAARERHPRGRVTNRVAYRIDDETVLKWAKELEGKAGR